MALAVITSTVEAQEETGFLNRTVTIGGKRIPYQVYVPFDCTPARRWPVILFLRGAGERRAAPGTTRQRLAGHP